LDVDAVRVRVPVAPVGVVSGPDHRGTSLRRDPFLCADVVDFSGAWSARRAYQPADQRASGAAPAGGGRGRMTRVMLRVGVAILLAGGVWLYAVRGEAILMDLQT